MILRVYRTKATFCRSVLYAEQVAEIEVDKPPEDPQAFADEYDGDFIDSAPRPRKRGNNEWRNTA